MVLVVDATRCTTLSLHCNTLQHTTTHCNTLQHTAKHCNTLQHTNNIVVLVVAATHLHCIATHCNALQHTATHCNTLQHNHVSDSRCNTLHHTFAALQHSATHSHTLLPHSSTLCNTRMVLVDGIPRSNPLCMECPTLQHTATHCNTLQLTTTHYNSLQRFSDLLQDPAFYENTLMHMKSNLRTWKGTHESKKRPTKKKRYLRSYSNQNFATSNGV